MRGGMFWGKYSVLILCGQKRNLYITAVIAELKKLGFQEAVTIECEQNGAQRDYVVKTCEYLQGLLDK